MHWCHRPMVDNFDYQSPISPDLGQQINADFVKLKLRNVDYGLFRAGQDVRNKFRNVELILSSERIKPGENLFKFGATTGLTCGKVSPYLSWVRFRGKPCCRAYAVRNSDKISGFGCG